MDKLDIFPKENHEKKQLEEIAHLYFSDPAPPPSEAHKEPKRRVRSFEAFSPFPRALFVHCAADRSEEGALSTWFLFNLAVMLKILSGPVLLIGSERAYEKRFLFGFRPDRERLRSRDGPPTPSGAFGPMGVCLLDGRVLHGDRGDEREQVAFDPMAGRQVAFRYILSDKVQRGGVFRSLPGLLVLLVTPATTTPGLLDRALGADGEFFEGPGHVGIVVAGAGCAEEADALYLYWRDRVEERCEREPAVENFGVFPAAIISRPLVAGPFGDRRFPIYDRSPDEEMSGMGIFEDPGSARTRFCQTTAALIRKKRSEMLPSSA